MELIDVTKLGDEAAALKDKLNGEVIGQEHAVDELIDALEKYHVGLNDKTRPVSCLLFLGSSGVGKTKLCQALAEHMCGDVKALIRVDCAEFQHSHEIAKLIGAPPGYIGHTNNVAILAQANLNAWRIGQTYDEQIKPQNSILLFDEIEKADDALWKILLGIMDNGRVTLGNSAVTDLTKTVIVMTGNIGSDKLQKLAENGGMGFQPETLDKEESLVMKAAKQKFPVEFINRLDKIIVFRTLTEADAVKIVDIELGRLQRRIASCKTPFILGVQESAKRQIVKEGYSKQYGARAIRRVIDREIANRVSHALASKQIGLADIVAVRYCDGYQLLMKDRAKDSPIMFKFREEEILDGYFGQDRNNSQK